MIKNLKFNNITSLDDEDTQELDDDAELLLPDDMELPHVPDSEREIQASSKKIVNKYMNRFSFAWNYLANI